MSDGTPMPEVKSEAAQHTTHNMPWGTCQRQSLAPPQSQSPQPRFSACRLIQPWAMPRAVLQESLLRASSKGRGRPPGQQGKKKLTVDARYRKKAEYKQASDTLKRQMAHSAGLSPKKAARCSLAELSKLRCMVQLVKPTTDTSDATDAHVLPASEPMEAAMERIRREQPQLVEFEIQRLARMEANAQMLIDLGLEGRVFADVQDAKEYAARLVHTPSTLHVRAPARGHTNTVSPPALEEASIRANPESAVGYRVGTFGYILTGRVSQPAWFYGVVTHVNCVIGHNDAVEMTLCLKYDLMHFPESGRFEKFDNHNFFKQVDIKVTGDDEAVWRIAMEQMPGGGDHKPLGVSLPCGARCPNRCGHFLNYQDSSTCRNCGTVNVSTERGGEAVSLMQGLPTKRASSCDARLKAARDREDHVKSLLQTEALEKWEWESDRYKREKLTYDWKTQRLRTSVRCTSSPPEPKPPPQMDALLTSSESESYEDSEDGYNFSESETEDDNSDTSDDEEEVHSRRRRARKSEDGFSDVTRRFVVRRVPDILKKLLRDPGEGEPPKAIIYEPADEEKQRRDIRDVQTFLNRCQQKPTPPSTRTAPSTTAPDDAVDEANVDEPAVEPSVMAAARRAAVGGVLNLPMECLSENTVTTTGRDTEITCQYHLGTTASTQFSSTAMAKEFVSRERLGLEDIYAVPKALRWKLKRFPGARQRATSGVLRREEMRQLAKNKLMDAWSTLEAKAAESPATASAFLARRAAMEKATPNVRIILTDMTVAERVAYIYELGFSREHAEALATLGEFEFCPRLLPEIPMSQGTINLAVLLAGDDSLFDFLILHIDKGDLQDGGSILSIQADNVDAAELQFDISSSEEAQQLAAQGVETREVSADPGCPPRWGVGLVKAGSLLFIDLKTRPHVVLKGKLTDASKPGHRASGIYQVHEETAAQYLRGEASRKSLVSAAKEMEMMRSGELPFSEYDVKVMLGQKELKGSRWSDMTLEELRELFETYAHEGEVNAPLKERLQCKAEKLKQRMTPLEPTPQAATPSAATSLAAKLGLRDGSALHAALASLVPAARLKVAEATLEATLQASHTDWNPKEMTEAEKAGIIGGKLLAAPLVDSIILSLLDVGVVPKREAEALFVEREEEIVYALNPAAIPQFEHGARRVRTRLEFTTGELQPKEYILTIVARAFFNVAGWRALYEGGAFSALAERGDRAVLDEILARRKRSKLTSYKRRYQGTQAGPAVLHHLSRRDCSSLLRGDLNWSEAHVLLKAMAGPGVQTFLVDKMLLLLVALHQDVRVTVAPMRLGPGARVGYYSLLTLLRKSEFLPAYQLKTKDVPSESADSAMKEGAEAEFIDALRSTLLAASKAYVEVMVRDDVRLSPLVPLIMDVLTEEVFHCITVENVLCELMRRRACALAVFAKRWARLLKNKWSKKAIATTMNQIRAGDREQLNVLVRDARNQFRMRPLAATE
jgi:hypothetical protein